MLKNYFIIAWRNLWRNKSFSIINLSGLAIGLCCFLLIGMYVTDELSFDRFNAKADRIYRINVDAHWGGQDIHLSETPDIMGPVLKKDYPQVEEYTRLYTQTFNNKFIKKGNEFIPGERIWYADSTFFDVFTLPAIDGNTKTAFNDPHDAVITASTAIKYFGSPHVAGNVLTVKENGNTNVYKIKAVIKDVPENSHFQFDVLLAMNGLDYNWGQAGNHNFDTYLLLKEGTDYKAFDKNFFQYIKKYLLPELKSFQINSMEDFAKAGNKMQYTLVPLTKIHLYSKQIDEVSPPGSIQYVYIFSLVAVFILLIACVNFMNLTTARAAGRAKEVGIRKVLGTQRKQLIRQFLSESIVMVSFSLIIALVLAGLALPMFNSLSGKSISAGQLFSPMILPIVIGLPFIVGLLAGSYPAFFLSAFKPIEVLKGKIKAGSKSGRLRSLLVVFQFTTSIILIIGTLVVYRQLHYIQNRNIGFDKQQLLIVNGADVLGNNNQSFKNDILRLPDVESGTISSYLPVSNSFRNAYNISRDAVSNASNNFNVQYWTIDYDYLRTMGMKLVKGRNFSHDFAGDSSAVIINETTAKILGHANPVGKNIYITDNQGKVTGYPIIGVVGNFNYESMHQDIGPLVMALSQGSGLISFKINTTNISQTITRIEDKWKALSPGIPFSYRFMDESFNEMYSADQRVGKIALIFAALAIVIGCMGIFGLSAFIAEQRTKEIGIRKVLGASAQGIVQLLSREFMKLLTISFIIATPLAWWMMHKWLQDFAYRIEIGWWIFLVAGIATFIIALATVSLQSIKAAMADPVECLRAE